MKKGAESQPLDPPQVAAAPHAVSPPSAELAYHRIRQWIVEGRFRPGERLVEQRLATELDLSRTPIREAMRMLQSEGLVRVEANKGTTVRPLSIGEIADLYELRARLEGMAAELAATRATPEQLDRLETADQQFSAAVVAHVDGNLETMRDVFRCNDLFHLTILEASKHERLVQNLVRTVDHTLVFQAFRHYQRSGFERSVLFHHLLYEAVRTGAGSRAGRLMHEHVLQGRDQLLDVVEAANSIDALYAERGDPSIDRHATWTDQPSGARGLRPRAVPVTDAAR
jgi:DNA-binding GntR family transcriptional regulator